jgi:hypothetical protein
MDIITTANVVQRDLYFKIDFGDPKNIVPGLITYGFTCEPVPKEYRSTAIPGLYIRMSESELEIDGVYIQRRFSTITKIGLNGESLGLNTGDTYNV